MPSVPSDDYRSTELRELIRRRSIERYRVHAARYDQTCQSTWAFRKKAIAHLELKRGSAVLDVGCGTGLSFELLREAVGNDGLVIGVEQSPDMAELARERIHVAAWDNVVLINASADEALLSQPVDAVLFNYTHDICRCRASLENLFEQVRPGARVGMAGVKFFPRWLEPLNLLVYLKNRPYNGHPGQLRRPWDIVQEFVPNLQISQTQLGMGYTAGGVFVRPNIGKFNDKKNTRNALDGEL